MVRGKFGNEKYYKGERLNEYIHYVYMHIDPRTKEIVYIGRGQGQRAWMMRSSDKDTPHYGHRRYDHFQWYKELESEGYYLDVIVVLLHRGQTRAQAIANEKNLIEIHKPRFNSNAKQNWLNKHKEIILKVKELRATNTPFSKIAKELDIGTMTAWRMSYV
jgi:hypothetical protein